jgi:hypothetical protein
MLPVRAVVGELSCSAEVKNEWSYISTLSYVFIASARTKKLTFTLARRFDTHGNIAKQ